MFIFWGNNELGLPVHLRIKVSKIKNLYLEKLRFEMNSWTPQTKKPVNTKTLNKIVTTRSDREPW